MRAIIEDVIYSELVELELFFEQLNDMIIYLLIIYTVFSNYYQLPVEKSATLQKATQISRQILSQKVRSGYHWGAYDC